jgi:hypothetical protein
MQLAPDTKRCHVRARCHALQWFCITTRRDEISQGCGVKARGLADAADADDVLHLKFHMGFECDFRGAIGPLFFAPRFVALRWLVLYGLVWRGLFCVSLFGVGLLQAGAIACSLLR